MKIRRYALACDLQDDSRLIDEYKKYHKKVWPDIKRSIEESGIRNMGIYNTGTRLFMIIEVGENFSFERKEAMDAVNPKVQEWEKLLWKYQKAVPQPGPENMVLMDQIFEFNQT